MNRPYLADMEPKDVAYFFIDGHNIYKLDENFHGNLVEMMRTEVIDTVHERDKLVPKWPQVVDPSSISPTEFHSAVVGLSQLPMQQYDNSDRANVNFDIFHEEPSSGKFKGRNFAKYLMAKFTQLNSRGDEAEYVRLRTLLDSMTFDIEKGKMLGTSFMHCELL